MIKTARLFALGIFLSGGMLLSADLRAQEYQGAPKSQSAEENAATVESTEDYNRKLERLREQFAETRERQTGDYRIGPQDLLDINIFEAPELNRTVRVSENGEVSLPLLGGIHVVRLTARELENTLAVKLREFLKDPHVSVMVTAIESHPVSVIGEVNKPGVFQVRGSKTLLEMLSMAQGLAPDAGDEVLVMRNAGYNRGQDGSAQTTQAGSGKTDSKDKGKDRDGIKSGPGSDDSGKDGALKKNVAAASAETTNATASIAGTNDGGTKQGQQGDTLAINLRHLLNSRDPGLNVPIYAGDIVKVTRAGIVYVVGAVRKPGGFTVKGNEQMSLLKAIALAEGLSSTSSKGHTRIIRTDEGSGKRSEIPVELGKILDGKAPDMNLQAADIVFVPNSTGKTVLFRSTDAIVNTASGVAIFHP
ncbi:MAG TPA: polysaccharide biosynthesis/export family protein [Candidatus Acidoferrales bacterium]|nr:polysaccharide biosynthesis/export family protein [Candidatus Acidoferrales bacterium]